MVRLNNSITEMHKETIMHVQHTGRWVMISDTSMLPLYDDSFTLLPNTVRAVLVMLHPETLKWKEHKIIIYTGR